MTVHFVSFDNVYKFGTTTQMLHKILILTNIRDIASQQRPVKVEIQLISRILSGVYISAPQYWRVNDYFR